jgi:Putative metal-binding motif
MLALILMGCNPTPVPLEGKDSPTESAGDSPSDSGGHSDSPPVDRDGDGATADEDCDDRDADRHPGAVESWDDVDQDCDGQVDADGDYSGTVAVQATAVYEGQAHRFSLSCPAVAQRSAGNLSWSWRCEPDPTDSWAQLLLGPALEMVGSGTVTGAAWSGSAELRSENGWDTRADASLRWSDFENLTLQGGMSAFSLELASSGPLQRR